MSHHKLRNRKHMEVNHVPRTQTGTQTACPIDKAQAGMAIITGQMRYRTWKAALAGVTELVIRNSWSGASATQPDPVTRHSARTPKPSRLHETHTGRSLPRPFIIEFRHVLPWADVSSIHFGSGFTLNRTLCISCNSSSSLRLKTQSLNALMSPVPLLWI